MCLRKRIILSRGRFLEAALIQSPFEESASMRKHSKHVPPALKHGIYSGIGLLPTEDPAKFQAFKQDVFDELAPVGRLEEDIVEHIACLVWRRQNLFTYCLANRARAWHSSIYSTLVPSMQWELSPLHEPETRSPEELAALRQSAGEQARAELGAAIALVEIGEVATIEYLEKELAIFERLNGMIARAFKSLLYVRGIKSMSGPGPAGSPQPFSARPHNR
jgi:hypothetical protein